MFQLLINVIFIFHAALATTNDAYQKAFEEGLSGLQAKDWAKAQAGFRQALDIAPDQANAWSNLARVAVETKDWSSAIAFYRQAALLAPGHSEAAQGVAYVTEKAPLVTRQAEWNWSTRLHREVLSLLTWPTAWILTFIPCNVFLWLLLRSLGERRRTLRGEEKPPLPWSLYLWGVLSVATLATVFLWYRSQQQVFATVLLEEAKVTSASDATAPTLDRLPLGLLISLVQFDNSESEWVFVETPFGLRGWMQQKDLFIHERNRLPTQ